MEKKARILLIDQHPEWLSFARDVLKEDYVVSTITQKKNLLPLTKKIRSENAYDLVFIGLELATNNLDELKPLFKEWHFVVVFPVIQENDTVRLLFKAGVYDCARKPYEREGLLKLVAEELEVAKLANGHNQVPFSPLSRQETAKKLASFLNLEE